MRAENLWFVCFLVNPSASIWLSVYPGMLRSEFRFPIERWPQRLLASLLGEAFLGFLAIVAVALTLFPMLFTVKPAVDAAIDTAQWIIIGWLAFEYVFAFASARAKTAFLRSPWRWLDLATILIPLASL